MIDTDETIAGEFKRLDSLRESRLQASELFAYYTIPSVFPKEDASDNNQSVGMLDSIGSAVVNHFANKLVTTLFSPNRPFFRLMPDAGSSKVKKMYEAQESENPDEQKQAKDAFTKLRSKFVTVEKNSVRYLERIGYRTAATNAAKLLIITGDVVIRSSKNNKSTAYSMRDYVCEKDLTGRDVVLIVRDSLVYGALSVAQRKELNLHNDESVSYTASSPIVVYTRMEIQKDGRYKVTQAIDNYEIPQSVDKLVTEKDLPFTHLSWNLSKGENYGRGLVEDFSGSFHMIDNFTRYQATMGAKMADFKILVDPASGIDIEQLNRSETGTYIAGKPGDVQNLVTGMDTSLQYLEQIIMGHKRQISAAFLFQAGQTRDAERVTAEEIRENAAELEIAHGGVYSRFASDWQAKVAREAVKSIGEDMGDVVEPQIMTGMDSLSRTGEMQAVRVWINDLSLTAQIPDDVRAWLKGGEFAQYAAIQRGVDHGAFVKSDAEMKAEQEARQAQEAAKMQQEADQQQQVSAANVAAQAATQG